MKSLFALVLLLASSAVAQSVAPIHGDCSTGNTKTITQGLFSSTLMRVSYPQCLVTVYDHGTTNLSTLYSDDALTPLSNPFTATTNGSFMPYAIVGGRYDLVLSGGLGANNVGGIGFPTPFTIADIHLLSGGSSCSAINILHNGVLVGAEFGVNLIDGATALWLPVPTDDPPNSRVNVTPSVAGAAGKIIAGATPALTYTPVLGVPNSADGTLGLASGGANATTTLQSGATTNWTLKFPATAGTSGWFLQTNGSGVTTWAAAAGGTGCTTGSGNAGEVLSADGSGGCQYDDNLVRQSSGILDFGNGTGAPGGLFTVYATGSVAAGDETIMNGSEILAYNSLGLGFHSATDNFHGPVADAVGYSANVDNYQAGKSTFGAQLISLPSHANTVTSAGALLQAGCLGGKTCTYAIGGLFDTSSTTGSTFSGAVVTSPGIFSDGNNSIAASYKNWAAVFEQGKIFTQDIVMQPELNNTAPLFGVYGSSGNAMSEVTCDSTQRGRFHYKNSGTGVADVLEVCMKNAADSYAWETVTVTP